MNINLIQGGGWIRCKCYKENGFYILVEIQIMEKKLQGNLSMGGGGLTKSKLWVEGC